MEFNENLFLRLFVLGNNVILIFLISDLSSTPLVSSSFNKRNCLVWPLEEEEREEPENIEFSFEFKVNIYIFFFGNSICL
jgi:hypothetical protein